MVAVARTGRIKLNCRIKSIWVQHRAQSKRKSIKKKNKTEADVVGR